MDWMEEKFTEIKDEEVEKLPIDRKLNLTIPEAAEYSNIGQNRISDMLNNPRCPFVLYVGRKRLIKRKEFEEYLSAKIEV